MDAAKKLDNEARHRQLQNLQLRRQLQLSSCQLANSGSQLSCLLNSETTAKSSHSGGQHIGSCFLMGTLGRECISEGNP